MVVNPRRTHARKSDKEFAPLVQFARAARAPRERAFVAL